MADDVVGSATVSIEPDFSQFESMLQAAIGPALADAVSSVNDAVGEMVSSFDSGGGSLGSALSDGISQAAESASESIGEATNQMSLDFDGVASSSDAMVESIAAAADTAALVLGEVGDGADTMALAIAEGADQAAVSLEMINEGTIDATHHLGEMESEGSEHIHGLSDTIVAVAIGSLIADGIEEGVKVALDALESLVEFLPELGHEYHTAFLKIRVGAGETGGVLRGMEEDTKAVFAKTPASLNEVSSTLATLKTRFGLTGESAQDMALKMIRLARITGGDVGTTVDKSTQIFGNFGIGLKDQGHQLDLFLRTAQTTYVTMPKLMNGVQRIGPAFKAAGFEINETASVIGGLSKVGVEGMVVQRALAKIGADAAPGQTAKQRWDQMTGAIRNAGSEAEATSLAFTYFGKMAGPKVSAAVRAGALDYQQTVNIIKSGGDTIEDAAKAAGNWQTKLTLFSHVLKNQVEPIASGVFEALNEVVAAVMPPITALVKIVGGALAEAWDGFLVIMEPVIHIFEEFKVGFQSAADVLNDGMGPMAAIVAFFKALGDVELGVEIVQFLKDIGTAAQDLWTGLQPVRDAIIGLFDSIVGAIASFIATNADTVFVAIAGGLAAMAAPIIIGALGTLASALLWVGSTLLGVIGNTLIAVSPFLAVAAAVGVVYLAFKTAYNHIDGFRSVVDTAVKAVKVFMKLHPEVAIYAIGVAMAATFGPKALASLWGFTAGMISFASATWSALAPILVAAAPWIALAAAIAAVIGLFVWAYHSFDAFRNVIDGVASAVRDGVGAALAWLSAIVTEDVMPWLSKLGGYFADLWTAITSFDLSGIGDALSGLGKTIWDAITGMLSSLGNIGVTLWDWLKSGFEWVVANGPGLLSDLASWIGGLASQVLGWLGDVGGFLLKWFLAGVVYLVSHIPSALMALEEFLFQMAFKVLGWLGDLGAVLVEWAFKGVAWLVTSLPGMFVSVGSFLISLPGKIIGWLGDLGGLLLGWMKSGWDWLAQNWGTVVAAVFVAIGGIPALIIMGLAKLPGWLWDAVYGAFSWVFRTLGPKLGELLEFVTGPLNDWVSEKLSHLGEYIVAGLRAAWNFVTSTLPSLVLGLATWLGGLVWQMIQWLGDIGGQLLSWLWNGFTYLVTNAPSLLVSLADWLIGLPAQILGWLGDLGGLLFEWMQTGFDWVVEQAQSLIGGLIDFFTGLPKQIADAATGLWGALKTGLIEVINWIIEKVNNIPGIDIGLIGPEEEDPVGALKKGDKKKKKKAAKDDEDTPKKKKKAAKDDEDTPKKKSALLSLKEEQDLEKKKKADAKKFHADQQRAIQKQIKDLRAVKPINQAARDLITLQIAGLRKQLDPKKKTPEQIADQKNQERIDAAKAAGIEQARIAAGSGVAPGKKELASSAKTAAAAAKATAAQTQKDWAAVATYAKALEAEKVKQEKEAASAEKKKKSEDDKAAAKIARGEAAPGAAGRGSGIDANGDTVVINVVVQPPPGTDELWAKTLGNTVGVAAGEAAVRKLRLKNSVRAA